MTTEQTGTEPIPERRSWLWDHIGRITGFFLALITLGFIALLAFVGFRPAEGLLVFIVVVLLMIGLGGRLHGL
jgi:hypothetical protein